MSADKVWIAVKNKQAKDLNRQPLYHIRQYVVDRYTQKSVCLKCGKIIRRKDVLQQRMSARQVSGMVGSRGSLAITFERMVSKWQIGYMTDTKKYTIKAENE